MGVRLKKRRSNSSAGPLGGRAWLQGLSETAAYAAAWQRNCEVAAAGIAEPCGIGRMSNVTESPGVNAGPSTAGAEKGRKEIVCLSRPYAARTYDDQMYACTDSPQGLGWKWCCFLAWVTILITQPATKGRRSLYGPFREAVLGPAFTPGEQKSP